jgi:hypothetical protein
MGRRLTDFKTHITASFAAVVSIMASGIAKTESVDEQAQYLGLLDLGGASEMTTGEPLLQDGYEVAPSVPKPGLVEKLPYYGPQYPIIGDEPEGA